MDKALAWLPLCVNLSSVSLDLPIEGTPDGRHWSGHEVKTHFQGQRRSPSKMVGGVNSHLESNPISDRDAQKVQRNLHTRTQESHIH